MSTIASSWPSRVVRLGVDSHMIGVGDQAGRFDGAVHEFVAGRTFQVLDEHLSP